MRKIARIKTSDIKPKLKMNFSKKELKIQPLKDIMNDYPKKWKNIDQLSFKTSIFNSVAINLKSEEAKDIKIKMMKSGLKNLVIHQIERVKNLSAYHKYSKEKAII